MKCGNDKCDNQHNNRTYCSERCRLIGERNKRPATAIRHNQTPRKLSSANLKKCTDYFVHVNNNNR